MTPTNLVRILMAIIVALWIPTLAAAATIVMSHGSEPLVLDPVLIAFSCLLALMAGGTTLAIRLNMLIAADPEKPLVRPGLFCLAHMGGSLCAGIVGFMIGRQQSWDVWSSLIFVFVMSFGGARIMEALAEKYLGVFRPVLGKP